MKEGKPVKKVLIIRFSSLGDVVLTSLLVRCLKTQLGPEIHFLTKKPFAGLLVANPWIDRVWTLEQNWSGMLPQLKAEKFDLIVDLHKNLRSLRIRLALWPVPSTSYQKGNLAKWLSVYFKINRFPKDHIAIRYLHNLRKYGVYDDGKGLDFFIPDDAKVDPSGQFGIKGPYLALVIGAAHFTKRLPVSKLKELIASVDGKYPVVLIGGKDEQAVASQLQGGLVYNACGTFSIQQSASLLQQAAAVIAPDTGMMHIAAALQKPIRSIWGSTLAEFGFWPFYGNDHEDQNLGFEIKGLACRPCARFGRNTCPKGHFNCMMMQDMERIADSVRIPDSLD